MKPEELDAIMKEVLRYGVLKNLQGRATVQRDHDTSYRHYDSALATQVSIRHMLENHLDPSTKPSLDDLTVDMIFDECAAQDWTAQIMQLNGVDQSFMFIIISTDDDFTVSAEGGNISEAARAAFGLALNKVGLEWRGEAEAIGG
jgi:hypothetical protein